MIKHVVFAVIATVPAAAWADSRTGTLQFHSALYSGNYFTRMAADLDQYACKPYEVDSKLCVNTTKADCAANYPGRQWYPGYTCDDLTWAPANFICKTA